MFNQTTPGWMHWSSLPDTAGFLDTEGCKPPHYCHGLCSASAYAVLWCCMWWRASFPWWYQLMQKEQLLTSRSDAHHTWTTALGWAVPPYKQECQEAPSATLEATDTDAGHPPHHAHRWHEQQKCFRDASKTQGWRERSESSAHPVHWETVKKNASSAGGVRNGNQSRISRGSWVAD